MHSCGGTTGLSPGSSSISYIYINDIVNEIESTIKLFADVTSLSLALNDPDIRAELLNSDLDKIKNWARKWKVKFNEDKTDLLILQGTVTIFSN